MPDNKVQIIVEMIKRGEDVLRQMKDQLGDIEPQAKAAGRSVDSIGDSAISVGNIFKTVFGIGVVAEIKKVADAIIDYNKTMETSKLGIAAILMSMTQITDAQGRTLEGADKWAASQQLAVKAQKELQTIAMSTSATYQELVEVYQGILAPALSAKMTIKETLEITGLLTNSVKAIGLPFNQIKQEARDLIQGGIQPASSSLAVALGITDAMVKKWREQGTVFKELTGRLEGFKYASNEFANTWEGALSNVKDFAQKAFGEGFKPVFNQLKQEVIHLADSLVNVTRDASGKIEKIEIKPEIKEKLKEIAEAVMSVVRAITALVKIGASIVDAIGKEAFYLGVALAIGKVALAFVSIASKIDLATKAARLFKATAIGLAIEGGVYVVKSLYDDKKAREMADSVKGIASSKVAPEYQKGLNLQALSGDMIKQITSENLGITENQIADAILSGAIKIAVSHVSNANQYGEFSSKSITHYKAVTNKTALEKLLSGDTQENIDAKTKGGDKGSGKVSKDAISAENEAFSASLAKLKNYTQTKQEIIKSDWDYYVSALENSHKRGEMSDSEFYSYLGDLQKTAGERKLADLQTNTAAELKLIEKHKSNLEAAWNEVIGAETKPEKKKGMEEKRDAALSALSDRALQIEQDAAAKKVAILNGELTKEDKAKTEQIHRQLEMKKQAIETEFELTKISIENQLAVETDSIKQKEEQYKFLHDAKLMEDKDYYAALQKLREEDVANQKRALDSEYEAYMDKKTQELADAATNDAERQKILDGMIIYNQTYHNKLDALTRDSVDRRTQLEHEAAQNMINDMNKVRGELENMFVKMFESPKSALKDFGTFVLNELKSIAAKALANPIVIPITQAMYGVGGSAQNPTGGLAGSLMGTGSLSGFMPYAIGASPALSGNWAGAGGGLIGAFLGTSFQAEATSAITGGIASIFGDGVSDAIGGALFDAIPLIGPLIGSFLGSALSGLGKGDDNLGLHINPTGKGLAYYGGRTQGEFNRGSGWYEHNLGNYHATTDNMGEATWASDILRVFKKQSESIKTVMEAVGFDTSGFDKEFKKASDWKAGSVTPEQMASTLKGWFGEWITTASGIDFSKFQTDGEELVDTITRIVNALGKIAAAKDLDPAKMFEDIDIHANTMKQALDKLDGQLLDSIHGLDSLTGQEYGAKLEEIGTLLDQRYTAEIQYMTAIKTLQETSAQAVAGQIDKYKMDTMSLTDKVAHFYENLTTDWKALQSESDPQKIEALTNSMTQSIDAEYQILGQLRALVDQVHQLVSTTLESFDVDVMDKQQKVDFFNQKVQDLNALYKTAANPEEKADLAKQMTEYIKAGWGILSDEEKKAALPLVHEILDPISKDMEGFTVGFGAQMDAQSVTLAALNSTIQNQLLVALGNEITAINDLKTAIIGINYSALGVTAPAAGAAGQSGANTAAGSGAAPVIEQNNTFNFTLKGDMSKMVTSVVVDEASDKATKNVINILRNDPSLVQP